MPLPTDDCDDCRPAYLQRRLDSVPRSTIIVSFLPFILTFVVASVVVSRKILPLLLGPASLARKQQDAASLSDANGSSRIARIWRAITARKIASATCVITIALSSVLVELILCEISNSLNPAIRGIALRTTLYSLLLLIILIVPALEIHSVVGGWFRKPTGSRSNGNSRRNLTYLVTLIMLGAWLACFWYLPRTSLLPDSVRGKDFAIEETEGYEFVGACLERIGIIGIALMASLAGFAAVSSIWQTFGVRHRLVRETDVSRKETGLAATQDMLATKQSRLRALLSKQSHASPEKGIFSRVIGTFRPNTDSLEQQSLEMEINGLETMTASLSSSATALRSRLHAQRTAHTFLGRLTRSSTSVFAVYCLYRIGATSFSSLRRWWSPSSTFATSDPINNVLALLTAHYDASLDRAAWARQISFLLSGIMLLLSFSSVLQTSRLFSRFAPSHLFGTSLSSGGGIGGGIFLPLAVAQVAGTYVISSTLLLRSNLPREMRSAISDALGEPLDARFVEAWFESWFLIAVGLTAVGILVSRKVVAGGGASGGIGAWDFDDDEEDFWVGAGGLEAGKRS